MDVLYDLVESIHVFIPLVAVLGLILVVYLCGIGQGQQPDDSYIRHLEKLDASPLTKPTPPRTSLPKPPAPKSQPPKSPTSIKSSVTSKVSTPTGSDDSALRQRTASAVKSKATKPAKKEEKEEAVDGEWKTVTPKRRGKTDDRAPSPDQHISSSPVKTSPETPEKVLPSTPAHPSPSKEASATKVESPTKKAKETALSPELMAAQAEAEKQIQALMGGVAEEEDKKEVESSKSKTKKKRSEASDVEESNSTNGSYSFGTGSTRTDSSTEVLSPRLSGQPELVEEEENGVLIVSHAGPSSELDTPEEETSSPSSQGKKKKTKKKRMTSGEEQSSLDVDDDGGGDSPESPFTTVSAKKKSRPRRV